MITDVIRSVVLSVMYPVDVNKIIAVLSVRCRIYIKAVIYNRFNFTI
jgi:hypothetical protein